MTTALIDGDIVVYRCAASCLPSKKKALELGVEFNELEIDSEDVAILRLDELMYRILSTTGAESYKVFISGSDNFRKELDPTYKANRDDKPKPPHFDACRQFLIDVWNAKVCGGHEADDAIGMEANEDTIVCSIDKDLLQIPGEHYNFVKDEFVTISDIEAEYNFWYLMLVGDTSDNVKGVEGIGPVKAKKLLDSSTDWAATVKEKYNDDERFHKTMLLLRVVRSKEELNKIETTIRQGEGSEPTKACSSEDFDPFSTINS